jgi:hypothetical protein
LQQKTTTLCNGNKGETKIAVAKELSLMIMPSGCTVKRDPKQIANKINKLVRQYRDAIAFKNSTGQQHMSDAVYGICKYFKELDPILHDHPLAIPLLTNKQSLDVEVDEDEASTGSGEHHTRASVAASSPELRNAAAVAHKKISSSYKQKMASSTESAAKSSNAIAEKFSVERKSLVPKKRKEKKIQKVKLF